MKILSLLHKVQDSKLIRVLILDDTIEDKVGKNIEGSCDNLWSNKLKRKIRGLNVVSLNYSDGFSNLMLDFAIAMNNYARVKMEDFTNIVDHRTNAHKRRLESKKGKSQIAIESISYYLENHPHHNRRVPNPKRLPRRRPNYNSNINNYMRLEYD